MPQQYLSRYFKPKEDNTNQGTDTTDSRNRVTYRSRTATGKSTTEKAAGTGEGGSRGTVKATKAEKRKAPSAANDAPASSSSSSSRPDQKRGRKAEVAPEDVWICPHCTFRNDARAPGAATTAAGTCQMCGQIAPPGMAAAAVASSSGSACKEKPEEIEIPSSSDSDGGGENDGHGGNDDRNGSDNSDSEDVTVGQHRKRAKAAPRSTSKGAAAQRRESTSQDGATSSSDTKGKQKRKQASNKNPSGSRRGTSSSNGIDVDKDHEDHAASSQDDQHGASDSNSNEMAMDGSLPVTSSSKLPSSAGASIAATSSPSTKWWSSASHNGDDGKAGSPGSSSSKGAAAAEAGSGVTITPEIFQLRENLGRRQKFQASVKAADAADADSSRDAEDASSAARISTDSSVVGGCGSSESSAVGDRGGDGHDAHSGAVSNERGPSPGGAGATTADGKTNAGGKSGAKKAAAKGKGKGRAKAKGGAGGVGDGGVKLTPMEQQVSDLKARHPGVLLLVECGYRYRFFGDDALVAAKVLRIYSHLDHNFQVASVPTYRLPVHLRRLVDAGYKVGVVRQSESAALKAAGLTETGKKSGTFKRELAAVFSQATWVEGAVEALMPASTTSQPGAAGGNSNSNSNGNGGGAGGSKGVGQGSWRKIGGAWRRVGGWGGRGGGGGGGSGGSGGVSQTSDEKVEEPASESDLDPPLPPVDDERSEQWLLSIYEEDASPGASPKGGGEPLSIALALQDNATSLRKNKSSRNSPATGGSGNDDHRHGEEHSDSDDATGNGADAVDTVRAGVVAVDVRTGKVVYDAFVERAGQRRELDTRLRHLKPLELIAPGPRLSKATEATLLRYCDSAVDGRGDKRFVRTERLPPEDFCFDAAQTALTTYYGKEKGREGQLASPERTSADTGGGGGARASALTQVLDLPRPAICALGPLIAHLERFGLDRALAVPDLTSFSQSQFMTLDAVTLRDLEVLECQADGREAGSLFSVLNRTQTAFGRRVLSGWVRQPLLSVEDIAARQDAVEELATDPPSVIERLQPALRDLKDVDPAIASLHHRRIQPSRLLSLLTTMRKVFAVFHPAGGGATATSDSAEGGGGRQAQSTLLQEAIASVPASMIPVINRFLGELDPEAAASDDYVRALVDGESLCQELAAAAEAEEAAKDGLDKELQSVRRMLRKPSLQWKSLRTGVTSTVEYLVELRKAEGKKLAPASWMQVSQTKDLVRFHTPEVLKLQQELLRARESRNIAARQAWVELVSQADEACYQGFRLAVHALGTLDALLSLALVANLPGYVRPVYRSRQEEEGVEGDGGSGGVILLRGARHPTVERVLEGGFVPNDVDLRQGGCLVVTGPNMGGKSSTVRMVALICIMGQMGSYVPADCAELYCLDGVYTRMGAGDDLAADMSTFMVELWHTSYILKHATRRSLVVLDELGRGTSTHDGVAIALATLRHVVRDLGCATLFVTHYPQVADLAADKSLSGQVKNAHMSFIENQTTVPEATGDKEHEVVETEADVRDTGGSAQGVTFLYRLVVGQAHRSYGINVARAAGMDEEMIKLASVKSAEMRDSGDDKRTARETAPAETGEGP